MKVLNTGILFNRILENTFIETLVIKNSLTYACYKRELLAALTFAIFPGLLKWVSKDP